MADKWQSLLDEHGALRDEQGVYTFQGQAGAAKVSDELFVLDQLGCLLVEGRDARKFLQGQVTCDMNQLSATHTVIGGHCNTKGRLLFSFRAMLLGADEGSERIALLMHRGLLAAAEQALAKFIVFSKASLSQDNTYRALGLAGSFDDLSQLPAAANDAAIQTGNGSLARVHGDRFIYLLKEEAAIAFLQSASTRCQLRGHHEWNLAEIRSGLGQVVPGTEDMFIPQMLNMQITGGVSFTKGCYIGQEVVARMQYRGKLKRHMRRLEIHDTSLPLPGAPLYTEGSSQSVGNLVLAAPNGAHSEMLAVVTDEAFARDALYLDQEGQQKLSPLDLPYSIDQQ